MKKANKKTSRKVTKRAEEASSPSRKMRKDKEAHLIAINKFVTDFIRMNKKLPSQTDVARNVGLSRKSICSLIREIDLGEIAGTHITRIKTNEFLSAIFDQGMRGNVQSSKLWLQLVYQWSERLDVKHSGEIVFNVPDDFKPDI
jgi:hypothetical protein